MKKIILTTLMLTLSYSMPLTSAENQNQNVIKFVATYKKCEKIVAKKIMEKTKNKTFTRGALIGGYVGFATGIASCVPIYRCPETISKLIVFPPLGAYIGAWVGGLVALHTEEILEDIK